MELRLKIIQENLQGLKELFYTIDNYDSDEFFYLQTLILYYQGEINLLKIHISKRKNQDTLQLMANIRLQIIKQSVKPSDLKLLKRVIESNSKLDLIWKAEASFLLGWAKREIKEFQEAKVIFKRTYNLLWEVNAKKKAVKSLLNHVVCQSHIDPTKRYLLDFRVIEQKALEVEDPIVAGLCQLNMARDYRFLGSFDLSEELINKAIQNLERDRGSNNYYFAVLERCYLNIELKRMNSAHRDYQIIKESELYEIQEASKVILGILGGDVKVDQSSLDPVWQDVLTKQELRSDYKLTKNETQLFNFLTNGEQSKSSIISHLYGERIDIESAENRFKVLLSRLNKKAPNLVNYYQGFYYLNSGNTLKVEDNKVS